MLLIVVSTLYIAQSNALNQWTSQQIATVTVLGISAATNVVLLTFIADMVLKHYKSLGILNSNLKKLAERQEAQNRSLFECYLDQKDKIYQLTSILGVEFDSLGIFQRKSLINSIQNINEKFDRLEESQSKWASRIMLEMMVTQGSISQAVKRVERNRKKL